MNKLKITTFVGTRPELIRLSSVISLLDSSSSIEHILVHTGQNYDYELNEIFFEDLNIRKPDYFLDAAGKTAIETIGQILIKSERILLKEKPDAFLVLGDTNSCLCALPAKRLKIPIFHMEAVNRCFDQIVPEEINRKIVDHISDINLTYSNISREYLIAEGCRPERVIKTGSPMKEVIFKNLEKIEGSKILNKLKLDKFDYFIISSHREENIESNNFHKIISILNTISEQFNKRVIVSTHPRTRNKIKKEKIKFHKNVELLKPLGFHDYIHLQKNAYAVLSDSGTITEESSILNFPAINLREAHERPEGMEEASVIMTGLNCDRVLQSLEIIKNQPREQKRLLQIVNDYDVDNVSEKVLRIILSYTDFIIQNVWKNFKSN